MTDPWPDAATPTSHRAPRRRRRLAVTAVALVAVGLVAVGGQQLWDRHEATTGTASLDSDAPSAADRLDEREVPLSECRADDDMPAVVSLGSLDVKGCVLPVGRDGDAMGAPGNIHVAGWFDESAKPGEKGLAIIDGHSSGRYKDGIFNRLGELEPGAVITVDRGDGTTVHYAVAAVDQHPVAEAMGALYADARSSGADLALITCSGDYEASSNSYDDRTVVLATEIDADEEGDETRARA